EPVVSSTHDSLKTYSHKTRDLLILACTEVENFWQQYLVLAKVPLPPRGYFTREDYVKLCGPLYLKEFQINLPRYAGLKGFRPFATWSRKKRSLPWYDAYNNTKHDRKSHFHDASLHNCLNAVTANIVLFSVRFGPYRLFQGRGTLASL